MKGALSTQSCPRGSAKLATRGQGRCDLNCGPSRKRAHAPAAIRGRRATVSVKAVAPPIKCAYIMRIKEHSMKHRLRSRCAQATREPDAQWGSGERGGRSRRIARPGPIVEAGVLADYVARDARQGTCENAGRIAATRWRWPGTSPEPGGDEHGSFAERRALQTLGNRAQGAFDGPRWIAAWLERAHPALGGRRPGDLLDTADGRGLVRNLLARQQSGAYA